MATPARGINTSLSGLFALSLQSAEGASSSLGGVLHSERSPGLQTGLELRSHPLGSWDIGDLAQAAEQAASLQKAKQGVPALSQHDLLVGLFVCFSTQSFLFEALAVLGLALETRLASTHLPPYLPGTRVPGLLFFSLCSLSSFLVFLVLVRDTVLWSPG